MFPRGSLATRAHRPYWNDVRTYLIIHNPVGDSKKPGGRARVMYVRKLLPSETWLMASQERTRNMADRLTGTYLARTPHGAKGNIKTSPSLMGRVFTAY